MLAALVIIAFGLRVGRPVLTPVLLAAFVAAVTAPLVLWLRERGVPTLLAVGAGLLVDALAIGGVALVVGGAVAELTQRQGFYQSRFSEILEETRAWLLVNGIEVSRDSLRNLVDPEFLVDVLGEGLRRIAAVLSRFVLVLFIVAFMLVEATHLRRKLNLVVQDSKDMGAVREAGRELKGFLVVKVGTSATTALAAGLLCKLLKIDLPLLWALLAFLLNFIPTVGSIIAAIPPTILALLLHGPTTALAVAGGYIVINAAIGSILEPRLMGDALGLSPLVVFLSMLVWGYLLGIVGALLSPILTMLVKTWMAHTDDLRWAAIWMGPAPKEKKKAADDPAVPSESPVQSS
ncbi:MAG: AI-2E family transporter [Myxococcota bacterium]